MEAIIRFIVTNRLFTTLLALIVVLVAWAQLPQLKISQYPTVKIPTLTIITVLPGASAMEIEQRVITELEDKLESIRNLRRFKSRIYNSFARTTIEYEYGVDIDTEYTDITSKINNLKTDLPKETEITVIKQSPVDLLISFVIAVVSDTATHEEMVQIAEELKTDLRNVPNLEEITVVKPDEEVRVDLDLARMSRYGITVQQVNQAIRGNNRFLPTGTFEIGDKAISVLAFSGGYKTLEALRDTMLISNSGNALALRDIATISKQLKEGGSITRVNGKPASWITMKLSASANVFDVKRGIDDVVARLIDKHSKDVDIVWLYDVEEGVNYKLNQLIGNILFGIAILSVILFFSVGYRSSMIITTMLPLALFLSVVGLTLTDYGIQEISLAGFIISLGLIVDNGIVVTENAFKLETYQGFDRREAAIIGTSSVISPLVSSTLTTALAFAPLYMLTSITGLFLHSMVATIWLCLGSSLIVAVTVSTLLLSKFGTENKFGNLPKPPSFMNALKPFRDSYYSKFLENLIAKPGKLALMIIALFLVTGWAAKNLDVIVFPDSEEPYFTITIEAPQDRTMAYVNDLAQQVYDVAINSEGVKSCSTIVGSSFPMVNTGIVILGKARYNAQLFCQVNFRDSEQLTVLTNSINSSLSQFKPLATINAAAFTVGGEAETSDIEVIVNGPLITITREQARAAEKHLREANIAGIRLIRNPAQSRWYALDIQFKERVANALGVTRAQVDQVLVLLTHGAEVDDYRDGTGKELPITLRADVDFEDPLAVFDRVFVTSVRGGSIPLSQVIDVSFGENEYDINHVNFKPEVKIGIEAEAGVSVSALTQQINLVLQDFEPAPGYHIGLEGEVANTEKEFGGAGKFAIIVVLVVLGIFILQFKSFLQPIIICAAIPLSFIGAFLMLWLTGQPMSFLAFIGLTSLMGIVINNSILLVDEGNRLLRMEPHRNIADIAVSAGVNRFMPIVLTSLTSICGLLPLALGNSMFKALAIVVIGGLTTSTFLTLLCVPVLYAYVTKGHVGSAVTHDWEGHSTLGE